VCCFQAVFRVPQKRPCRRAAISDIRDCPARGINCVEAATPRGGENSRMPFKSQAQRRKFAELLVQGKTSPDTFEDMESRNGLEEARLHSLGAPSAALQ
jgi:hypothetical protein